ncbi:MAG: GHKL domain-containing protein [Oscillospiraceae bacterium]
MNNELFWRMFEFVINFFECAIILGFPLASQGRKCSRKKHLITLSLCFTALLCTEYCYMYLFEMQNLVFIAISFTYAILTLKGSLPKRLAVSILPTFLLSLVNSLTIFIYSALFSVPINSLFQLSVPRVVVMIVSKLLFFLVLLALVRISSRNNKFDTFQWLTTGGTFLASGIALSLIIGYVRPEGFPDRHQVALFIVIICILLMSLGTMVLVTRITRGNEIKAKHALLLREQNLQKQSMELISVGNQEIRRIKHDLKNYITNISLLIDDGKYEQAREECRVVAGDIAMVPTVIQTGCLPLDLLVNQKFSQCRLKDIAANFSLTCPLENWNYTELCSALNNLFDNAIEYTSMLPVPDRKIQFEIVKRGNECIFDLVNKISFSVLSENPELKTTKADSENHGIGHISAQRILEKLGGRLEYSEMGNWFSAKAILPYDFEKSEQQAISDKAR